MGGGNLYGPGVDVYQGSPGWWAEQFAALVHMVEALEAGTGVADGSVTDVKVATGANIAQAKIAGLVAALAAKATPAQITDAITALAGIYLPIPAGAPSPGQVLSAIDDDPLTVDWIDAAGTAATTTAMPAGGLSGTTVEGQLYELDAEKAAAADVVLRTLVNAKGDIIIATADNTVSRLPVGADGMDLVADDAAATGLRWLHSGIFDPKLHGAVYDGATGASAAINAAIAAAKAAGGGVVEVRTSGASAIVYLDADVVVEEGVWFRGIGSGTVFTGPGKIRIPGSGAVFADRIKISDFSMTGSTASVCVDLDNLGGIGGLQLGWPRLTVENVTVVDPTGIGFRLTNSAIIEARLINCVVMRPSGVAFAVYGTDNYLIGCSVGGAASGGGEPGFALAGGNNKLIGCKAYGLTGYGVALAGSGRHVISGVEVQDCVKGGYQIESSNNTLAACLSDTNGRYGFLVNGDNNSIDGSVIGPGGGGTAMTTQVGVSIVKGKVGNNIRVAVSALARVGGGLAGNTIICGGEEGSQTIAYAATVVPNPWLGRTILMTLTGNVVVKGPIDSTFGHRLLFLFRQDGTGSRTITFDSTYRTTAAWAPAGTPNTVDSIEFVHDGTRYVQTNVTLGITDRAAVVTDTFNRADGALGNADTGQAWTTSNGTCVVASNRFAAPTAPNFNPSSHAWVDAGVSDCTVQATMVTDFGTLTFRVQDASNFYTWNPNGIEKYVAGVASNIMSGGTLSYGAGDVLKVVCVGATLEFYKNGVAVSDGLTGTNSVADGTGVGRTKFGCGVLGPSGLVDNFSVA